MKRISTLVALFCLSIASLNSSAQCANPTTSGLTYQAGGLLTGINGGTTASTTITAGTTGSAYSGIYYINSSLTNLNVSFTANSAGSGGNTSNPTQYVVKIVDGDNGTNTVSTCTFNSPANVNVTGGPIYFTIPASALPVSTNFQVVLQAAVPSTGGSKDLIITNFSVQSGTAIQASNAALPVNFLGLEAKKLSNGTQLTWKVAQEMDVNTYELERSTDGKGFTTVATVAATGNSTYSATDYSAAAPVVYYRVKNTDKDGRYKFSTTIKVEGGKISFLKKAFPMPAVSEVFVQHDAVVGNAVITLSSQDGRVVKTIAPQAGSMQTRIDLSGLNSGLYLVRYDDGTGAAETLKVVKQ